MTTGGYSVERFISEPENCFTCGICLQVLKDPVQCKNGHLLCKSCASACVKRRPVCPSCNCSMNENSLSNNIVVRDIILEKMVKCENCLDGCLWSGKLCDSDRHIVDCLFRKKLCPSIGCGQILFHKDLDNHLENCQYVVIPCEFCQELKFRMHSSECEKKPVSCACGETMPKSKMAEHKLNACGLTVVQCPFILRGGNCGANCSGSLLRRNLPEHLSDPVNMSQALMCLMSVVDDMKVEIKTLQYQNKALKTQHCNKPTGPPIFTPSDTSFHFSNVKPTDKMSVPAVNSLPGRYAQPAYTCETASIFSVSLTNNHTPSANSGSTSSSTASTNITDIGSAAHTSSTSNTNLNANANNTPAFSADISDIGSAAHTSSTSNTNSNSNANNTPAFSFGFATNSFAQSNAPTFTFPPATNNPSSPGTTASSSSSSSSSSRSNAIPFLFGGAATGASLFR